MQKFCQKLKHRLFPTWFSCLILLLERCLVETWIKCQFIFGPFKAKRKIKTFWVVDDNPMVLTFLQFSSNRTLSLSLSLSHSLAVEVHSTVCVVCTRQCPLSPAHKRKSDPKAAWGNCENKRTYAEAPRRTSIAEQTKQVIPETQSDTNSPDGTWGGENQVTASVM